MEYVLLFGAIVILSLQFIFSKRYQLHSGVGFFQSVWFSLLLFAFTFVFFFTIKGFRFNMPANVWIYPLIYGGACVINEIGFISALNYGKVSIVSVYMTLGGAMFPFIYGILFLHEELSVLKILAVLLMLLSFLPTTVFKNKEDVKVKNKNKLKFIGYCILCFTANGVANLLIKVYQDAATTSTETDFIITASAISMVLAGLICFVYIILKRKNENLHIGDIINKRLLSKVCIISAVVCSLAYSVGGVLNMAAAKTMEASVQFPAVNLGVTILACVWGFVFNKEKLSKFDVTSVSLAAVSVVLIAF